MGPGGPAADSFSDDHPIDLVVGDSFVGRAGHSFGAKRDIIDTSLINVVAHQQYSFVATSSLPSSFSISR